MFKNFFKRKAENKLEIIQPLKGKLLAIEEVPDSIFSQKKMGEGFAVDPINGTLVAPIDGVVMSVLPTKHAICLSGQNGKELLIYVGMDTVNLKGEGFKAFVKEGEKIKRGQKLMEIDFDLIKTKVPSIITSVVFTNLRANEKVIVEEGSIKVIS
ncbi:PTS sugar transporter subunit IIA [Niallia sp. 01092]|uniref:PTS sugar transporter subunit IIA n=1 Tax=unclassified Niallia TaxID=2837522 RepID=UPI003FD28BD1